ncbi:hypothetical protein [Mucilaginibacter phyllosphaerae]
MAPPKKTGKKDFAQLPRNEQCWVAYLYPFTLIVPDGERPLEVPLDEINNNSYDHGQLCRIIGALTIQELQQDLQLLLCYDGALALPAIGKYQRKEAAVNYFNEVFACLLLGGFRPEAVDTRDVVSGSLHESRLIWPVEFGNSASSLMHAKLRMRLGSSIDNIILSKPSHLYLSLFKEQLRAGQAIFSQIRNLTPTFLITGFTELKYNNWSTALSNLWISVEQLTDFLWNEKVVPQQKAVMTGFPNRVRSMKEDSRTWSTTIKHEVLFQNGVIPEAVFAWIYPARQARNKLVHEGQAIEEQTATDLSKAVLQLIAICVGQDFEQAREILAPKNGYRNHFQKWENSFEDWRALSAKLSIKPDFGV